MNLETNEILNSIKETWYVTGTYPELDFMVHEFHSKALDWVNFHYTNIVYLDLPEKKEAISVTHTYNKEDLPKSPEFKSYLAQLSSFNLNAINYLCTFYSHRMQGITNSQFFQPFVGNSEIINVITRDTYGRIVFDYQAVNLYSLFSGSGSEKAWNWLKNFARTHPQAVVDAISIEIGEENLFDLLESYGVGKLYRPNRKGADRLWNFIQSRNQISI